MFKNIIIGFLVLLLMALIAVLIVVLFVFKGKLDFSNKLANLGLTNLSESNLTANSTQNTLYPNNPDSVVKYSASLNSNKMKDSYVLDVDSIWNRYSSNVLGFSIKYPKMMYQFYAGCVYKTANGDHSYRPQGGLVPTKIFEEPSNVYFSSEYFNRLTGSTEDNGRSYFSGCEKVDNSLYELKRPGFENTSWNIKLLTVKNDSDILKYIQANYGSSCQLGEKKPATQSGVYDVFIKGDGKDLSDTKCPINFMYVLKYYPQKSKLANWDRGQGCSFSDLAFNCYDDVMQESFVFE